MKTYFAVYNVFFNLLHSALWRESYCENVNVKTFEQLLALADEQKVFGLVFDVLKDIVVDGIKNKGTIFRAVGMLEKIKSRNAILTKDLVDFCKKNETYAVDYVVVKGQTIGSLYPKPELRMPGDIDFLFKQLASIKEIFPDMLLPKVMPEKEISFQRNSITYELHRYLVGFGCKKHYDYWEGLMAESWNEKHYIELNGVKVRVLPPTVNAVYVFLHLFFHLMHEGVAFRQFCDWAIILHHYRNDIDKDKLLVILKELGAEKAYRSFGTILVYNLGMPINEFPMELTNNDVIWNEKILYDIFKGGNFGKLNHHAKSSWRYKMETMGIVIRNSFRYYRLYPSEMRMMILERFYVNVRLLVSGISGGS